MEYHDTRVVEDGAYEDDDSDEKDKVDENTDLYITGVSQQRMKMYLLILVFSFQQESTLISCIQLVI